MARYKQPKHFHKMFHMTGLTFFDTIKHNLRENYNTEFKIDVDYDKRQMKIYPFLWDYSMTHFSYLGVYYIGGWDIQLYTIIYTNRPNDDNMVKFIEDYYSRKLYKIIDKSIEEAISYLKYVVLNEWRFKGVPASKKNQDKK